ncbi:MAG TPA: type II secretion system F family protein, partial [Egibacteraceae bacterium]|nr:type II secretion system F family protein [Egibacteraceae bacterium]
LAGTGLARLGEALAASERWGAPSAPALRQLAEELRADRRAAAEAAAERAQIALIFPTTLLTLPAFVLAVVPPLLWTAVAGTGGVGLS